MLILDKENADRDLTSTVTVLTHTPDTVAARRCQAVVHLGDGTKNLDGSGGDFELTISVGSQLVEPSPQTMTFGSNTRSSIVSVVFIVPAGEEVLLRVKSPNAGDSDVDVTAYLLDVDGQVHNSPAKAQTSVAGEVRFFLGASGLTVGNITCTIWKPGSGDFGASSGGTIQELSGGWYGYSAAAVDVDTIGPNVLKFVESTTGAVAYVTMIVEDGPDTNPAPAARSRPTVHGA